MRKRRHFSSLCCVLFVVFLCSAKHAAAQNADSIKKEMARVRTPGQVATYAIKIGTIYLDQLMNDSAFIYFNKALPIATNAHDDTTIMDAEMGIGLVLERREQFKESAVYYEKAMGMAKAANDNDRVLRFSIREAELHLRAHEIEKSQELCNTALQLAITARSRSSEAGIYKLKARIIAEYPGTSTEGPDAAVSYLNKSAQINDSLKNYKELYGDYMLMINVFMNQKRYNDALSYSLKLDSFDSKRNDPAGREKDRVGLAGIYSALQEYDKATKIYLETIKYFANDPYTLVYIYPPFAEMLSMKGDNREALKYCRLSNEINNARFHDEYMLGRTYTEIANEFFALKQFDSTLYYAQASLKIITNSGNKEDLASTIQLMAYSYLQKGDVKNAESNFRVFDSLREKMFTDNNAQNIAEQETKFKLREKGRAMDLLVKENELSKIKGQRLAIALLLGALIVIVIVVAYRRAIKKNSQLFSQKQVLEEQQKELRQQKKMIDDQVVLLASAATMKSKFLANISHELRTPVTLLTGMLELMSTKKPLEDAKEKERLNVAYNNSRKLQHMVEEILDLTKLENNVSQPVYETREIDPLLKRIVYSFETLIEKEHLTLQYEAKNVQDVCLSVDQNKFEKIINNLVYNAIKFNKENGTIKVSLSATQDKKSVEIEIADTGVGIAPVDLPHIFEHFYQSETSGAKADGAGIGLSLVKEFTLLMGGTVDVVSKPGEGSTFLLRFPAADPLQVVNEPEPDTEDSLVEEWEKFDARQTVLIVEDNAEMRYYIKEVLGDKVNIAAAGNGLEALQWLESNIPDLIISDVMMPGMDGRELVNKLKNDDRYKKIPVITLTALADTENQLSFLRMGIDDYMVKPFNADELRIRVYNLLGNKAEREIFNEQPAEVDDVPADSKEAEEFRSRITAYVLARLKNANVSVFDLAYELALSERQLYRLAKNLTGCTPAQLIKEVRLQKAYELLLSGDINKIEDVSKRVGFEKASYFSQQFFQRFGKRPSEFL